MDKPNKTEIGDRVEKLRGLVVDDTIVYRKILTKAVEDTGLCTVIKSAPNGSIALDWMAQKEFDVVLLDVFMPELDGIETLKRIKKDYPHVEVIMVSSDGNESVQNTVKALELGAMEFILKPSRGDQNKNIETITLMLRSLFTQIQIKLIAKRPHRGDKNPIPTDPITIDRGSSTPGIKTLPDPVVRPVPKMPVTTRKKHTWKQADLILIASSTGGPVALEKVLAKISQPLHVPVLIVQHMPKNFTRVLAHSLDQKSGMTIVEAEEGMEVESGKTIIAAGGYHMVIEDDMGKKKVRLLETDYVNGVRPAADVLFETIGNIYRHQRILVVVLTGMGNDGTKGLQQLSTLAEVYTIIQNEETCVVYGMPRSIDEAGLSDESLAIEEIGARIQSYGLRRR